MKEQRSRITKTFLRKNSKVTTECLKIPKGISNWNGGELTENEK